MKVATQRTTLYSFFAPCTKKIIWRKCSSVSILRNRTSQVKHWFLSTKYSEFVHPFENFGKTIQEREKYVITQNAQFQSFFPRGYSVSASNSKQGPPIDNSARPLEALTMDEVQDWLKGLEEFKDQAFKFRLSGKSLAGLSEAQFQKELGNIQGSALYNAVQTLKQRKPTLFEYLKSLPKRNPNRKAREFLDPFGRSMPLQDLERVGLIMWNENVKRYKAFLANIAERKYHPRFFVYGAPGIGKTRTGLECVNLMLAAAQGHPKAEKCPELETILKDKLVMLHVTFSKGYGLNEENEGKPILPERCIATRMLYYYVWPEAYFTNFMQQLRKFTTITLLDALAFIRMDKKLSDNDTLYVYLHVDEINSLLGYGENASFFKATVDVVSALACRGVDAKPQDFVIPLFSGTSYLSMRNYGLSSTQPLQDISLNLLSDESVYRIVEGIGFDWLPSDWKTCKPFLRCLATVGKLPRGLEYFLEECDNEARRTTPPKQLKEFEGNLQQVLLQAVGQLDRRYDFQPNFYATPVLCDAILGTQVSRGQFVEGQWTYHDLEQRGWILLEELPNSKCIVHIPFFWLIHLTEWTSLFNAPSVLMDPHRRMYWQHFEQLCADVQVLRANALWEQNHNKNTVVPLAGEALSYFGEAWGATSLKTKQINIHGPTVYKPLDKQFPRSLDIHEDKGKGEQGQQIPWWSQFGIVLKPCQGSKGLDTVTFRESTDGKILFLAVQSKWREPDTKSDPKLDPDVLRKAHNNTQEALNEAITELEVQLKNLAPGSSEHSVATEQLSVLKRCSVVMIACTNKPFNGKEKDVPEGCLVICRDNIANCFGPNLVSQTGLDSF